MTNLVLEHMTHALRGAAPFLSPLQYHPERGTLLYSEAHWGTFLSYAGLRAAGLDVEGAFQAWLVAIALANALAAWVLARTLGAPWWARGPLAFVACSTFMLTGKIGHPQILVLFPVFLALAALLAWIDARRPAQAAAFVLALAWVHLSCVYHGFFFSVVVALLVPSLLIAQWTAVVRDVRRYRWPAILLVASAVVVAVSALTLLYRPYAAFAAERGWTNPMDLLYDGSPRPSAWVSAQSVSWLYGRMLDPGPKVHGSYEKRLFPGLVLLGVPFVVVAAAAIRRRDRTAPALLPCALTVLAGMAFVTALGSKGPSPFLSLAERVEPLRAFRAPGRIAYVLLPLQVACLALVLRRLAASASPRARAAAGALVAVCVVESLAVGQVAFSFDKATLQRRIAGLVERVGRGARGDPFALTTDAVLAPNALDDLHLDAFQTALATGRPCVNGYSGTEPAWIHEFRARPTAENLDRALLEVKMPRASVEVVPVDATTAAPLRLPSRDWGRYRWGDRIDFSGRGTAGEFIVSGIDRAPAGWRWTIARRAVLRLTVEPSDRDRALVFEGIPLLGGTVTEQRIGVVVNGERVETLVLRHGWAEESRVRIPADLLRGRTTLEIALVIPGARRPKSLGLNDDRRLLGLALRWARIE